LQATKAEVKRLLELECSCWGYSD